MDEKELGRLSETFAALANPNRLRMYRALREREIECEADEDCSFTDRCCNVGELAAELEVSAATVSHHLKELNRAGLVATTRRGRFIYCSINWDEVARAEDFLGAHRACPPAARIPEPERRSG